MNYDVIVVGGGHAGIEACLSCTRLNHKTLLVTGNINNIADMPCNPSIGGPAKGIVVREIDALGGEMAKNTDKSSLQMKMLNTKKGPAVRALRAQADKVIYKKEMLKTLQNQDNLIDRYNDLFTNIEQEVENFKIQQEIDFESALKRSNERNNLRLEAIERNTRLIELLKNQEQCNINDDLIDLINERLE